MSKKATVMAVVNQKGGTGKTTTCENLGVGLAMEGKKVLVVDADPQASLTISLWLSWHSQKAMTANSASGHTMICRFSRTAGSIRCQQQQRNSSGF